MPEFTWLNYPGFRMKAFSFSLADEASLHLHRVQRKIPPRVLTEYGSHPTHRKKSPAVVTCCVCVWQDSWRTKAVLGGL